MADLLAEQRQMEDETIAGVPEKPASVAVSVPVQPLPEPYTGAAVGPLSDRERADLGVCEAALDNLRVAFGAAGKALQVIRDGSLYRESYDTFEVYVEKAWEMSRAQAYRLIDAWPLAERLSPMGDKLNERQVRALLPLAARHGQEAAATVYRVVAEAEGVQVTAAVLQGAIGALPADRFDATEAVAQIRSYLAGGRPDSARSDRDPLEAWSDEAAKLLRGLHRVAGHSALRAAAHENPDAFKEVIASLRALLDEIEHDVTPATE